LSEATGRYFGEYLSSASTIFYYPAVFKTRFAQTVENRLEESSLADDDIPTKVPPNSCFWTNTELTLPCLSSSCREQSKMFEGLLYKHQKMAKGFLNPCAAAELNAGKENTN